MKTGEVLSTFKHANVEIDFVFKCMATVSDETKVSHSKGDSQQMMSINPQDGRSAFKMRRIDSVLAAHDQQVRLIYGYARMNGKPIPEVPFFLYAGTNELHALPDLVSFIVKLSDKSSYAWTLTWSILGVAVLVKMLHSGWVSSVPGVVLVGLVLVGLLLRTSWIIRRTFHYRKAFTRFLSFLDGELPEQVDAILQKALK